MNSNDYPLRTRLLLGISITLALYFPLIIYGGYYQDDLSRTLTGYAHWGRQGRPLADIIMNAIFFGPPLASISPLPQFLAVVLLGVVLALVSRQFVEETPTTGILVSFFLVATPFMLQNMAFNYEAFFMALALLLAVLPFVFNYKNNGIFLGVCFASFLAILCLYQAAVNAYLAFGILDFLYLSTIKTRPKDALARLLISIVLVPILAIITYKVLIWPLSIHGTYATSHSAIAALSYSLIKATILHNLHRFGAVIKLFLTPIALGIISPIFLLSLGYISFSSLRWLRKRNALSIAVGIGILLSPIGLIVCIAGPMLLLKSAVFQPRVLLGAEAFFAISSILAFWALKKTSLSRYLKYFWVIPALYLFTVSYAYANARRAQEKLATIVITNVSADLNRFNLSNEKSIIFFGRLPYAEPARLVQSKYPVIRLINTHILTSNWIWSQLKLRHFGIDLKHPRRNAKERRFLISHYCNSAPLYRGIYYSLYVVKSTVIVDLKSKTCLSKKRPA